MVVALLLRLAGEHVAALRLDVLGPIEWRVTRPFGYMAQPGEPAVVLEWLRMRAPLPDDATLHAAVLAFVSDSGSLNGIEVRYGEKSFAWRASASLDHALWIHRPVRWDGWLLMETHSPVAHAARAHTLRRFWTRDGVHVATMAQEAVVRRERE